MAHNVIVTITINPPRVRIIAARSLLRVIAPFVTSYAMAERISAVVAAWVVRGCSTTAKIQG